MTIRSIAGALCLMLLGFPALALQQRSFVSSHGNDANPCTFAAPCRGFAAAVAQTTASGEVIALDSAGYGALTVTKSVSLIAPPGIYAGITVFSGSGVAINAPGAVVVLRGLSITGQGGGPGITVQKAARVRIENCVISNLSSNGILHSAPGAEMVVLDTIVRDNTGTGIGIAADATIVLDHVRSEHNDFDGLYVVPATSEVSATISDSVFVHNGANGISVDTVLGSTTSIVQVERSTMAYNGFNGFVANGAGGFSRNTVTRNAVDHNGLSGVVITGPKRAGDFSTFGMISDNQILANHDHGILADGDGAFVQASANTMVSSADLAACDLALKNGAWLATLSNNNAHCGFAGIIGGTGF